MECLDDLTLLDLASGLPAERMTRVEGHLADCEACRGMVAALIKGYAPARATTEPPSYLSPGARIGRYVVGECIGAGGMGVVYEARDPSLDRSVALKVVRRGGRARARLSREAQAMARLSHPNVVTVHDVIEHGDELVIAMELVDGETLAEWLARPHDWREIVDVFLQAGRGLAAAHAAALVHRDFKPSNAFVRSDGRVQVGDFGLARLAIEQSSDSSPGEAGEPASSLHADMTATGAMLGTPRYMAPEQRGGTADARSDQYSFCLALGEVLGAACPPALVPVIARGRETDPARRFASMTELLAALAAAAAPRRRRGLVMAGLMVVAVAITAGVAAVAGLGPFGRPHDVAATVAIVPFAITSHSTGGDMPDRQTVAESVVQRLGRVEGAHLSGLVVASAEVGARADFVVTGRIDEVDGGIVAELELVRVSTGVRTALHVRSPSPSLATLVTEVAREVAHAIAPASRLELHHDRVLAAQLEDRAAQLIRASKFNPALVLLDQAVEADPSDYEVWRDLVFVRSWLEAPPATIRETARTAEHLAPPSQRPLMSGIAAFCDLRYDDARAALAAAEHVAGSDRDLLRALHYYRGEIEWHDGHHSEGYQQFEAALRLDHEFGPATIHMFQYALAHRDVATARFIVGITAPVDTFGQIELAAGHYEELAASGDEANAVRAMLVLGRPVPAERIVAPLGNELDRGVGRIALALAANDRDGARSEFARLWKAELGSHPVESWKYYAVEILGEVLIAGELRAEAQQIVDLLAAASKPHPVRGYHRLAMLLGAFPDATTPIPPPMTFREHILAAAATAEHAGDHATAAKRFAELVGDPTPTWDFPERAALLRNLRALHRDSDAAALCADTLRPAIFRFSFLPLRAACAR